jgi:hypothetical protein
MTTVTQAALQASVRAHYYQPTRSILRPPTPEVERFGAGWALLVPLTYTVEMQPPEAGLHPHADQFHATVDWGTASILVVVIVLVLAGDRVVKRVFRLS